MCFKLDTVLYCKLWEENIKNFLPLNLRKVQLKIYSEHLRKLLYYLVLTAICQALVLQRIQTRICVVVQRELARNMFELLDTSRRGALRVRGSSTFCR